MAGKYEGVDLSDEERAALEVDIEGDETEAGAGGADDEKKAGDDAGNKDDAKPADDKKADDDATDDKKVDEKKAEPEKKADAGKDDKGADDDKGAADDDKKAGDDEAKEETPQQVSATMGPLLDVEKTKTRLDAIGTELESLKTKYGEGDLDVDEYSASKEDLIREQTKLETKLELSEDFQRVSVQSNWEAAQGNFLSQHQSIEKDKNLKAAFAMNVNEILGSEEGKSMGDYDILKQAYGKMSYLIPSDKKTEEQKAADEKADLIKDAKKTAAEKGKEGAPKTLAGVPAADDTTEKRFAHLDGLTGEALEKEVGRMSDADQDAWLKE